MSTASETKNHLIIGLGGTGGRVLRAFRKSIFQEFRTNEPVIEGLKLTYLYVDSSEEMMKFDDPTWKILGETVQLGTDFQLKIKGADLTTRLENIKNYPGIQHWIGSREQWRDILNSVVGDVLGGQKRRLGRFLFSCKATQFRNSVKRLVSNMENNGSEGATFHICCGLAGGTGSGSIVDALSQIRDEYREFDKYRIRIYAYLPETHPRQGWDAGNYHANGYAALLELNALSVGSWLPHDVTGLTNWDNQSSPSEKARFDVRKFSQPFTGCYLYTNVNDSGIQLDVETELPAVVSDFLYQKIVTARTVKLDALDMMENMENRSDKAEGKEGKEQLRSKMFLAFGVKRLAVPEEEIKEFLTFHFARQAALQMSFRHWDEKYGYIQETLRNDFPTFVRLKENLAKWKMSDDHLTLSIGILPGDANSKEWKMLPNEWQSLAAGFKDLARQGEEGKWLDRLETLYNDRFNDNFRKMGVKRFYEVKLQARRNIIREIRETLEAELFAEVKNGTRSVSEIRLLLTALVDASEERAQGMDKEIQKQREKEPGEAAAVASNKAEWARLGPLSRLFFKKHERLLDAQSICLERLYITRTQIEALVFAKQLLRELITELTDLNLDVDRCAATIAEGLRFFEMNVNSRCADEGERDLRKNVIRFYKPDKVREVQETFVKDEAVQRQQTGTVRARLAAELGEKQTFANFNLRIGAERFIDLCQLQCAESVEQVHEKFVLEAGGKGRLFGVNIIEKLNDEFSPGSVEFNRFIKDLVDHSGVLLPFDTNEINKSGPTIPTTKDPNEIFLVVRPKDPAQKVFVDALESAIKKFAGLDPLFADSVGKTNEICLIRIKSCFPLRYVKPLEFLKEKYDRRISSANSERAKLEIHLEGDGTQHNPLFVPSTEEATRQGLPYILLAKAIGLIRSTESGTTGVKQLALYPKDDTKDPIPLGKTIVDACESLDETVTDEIRQLVKDELKKVENLHVDKRLTLQEAVTTDLRALLESRGNDPTDPICKQFRDATKKAILILKGEG